MHCKLGTSKSIVKLSVNTEKTTGELILHALVLYMYSYNSQSMRQILHTVNGNFEMNIFHVYLSYIQMSIWHHTISGGLHFMYIPPSMKTGTRELQPYIDQSKNKMKSYLTNSRCILTIHSISTLYLCIYITLANKENLKCKLKIKKLHV